MTDAAGLADVTTTAATSYNRNYSNVWQVVVLLQSLLHYTFTHVTK